MSQPVNSKSFSGMEARSPQPSEPQRYVNSDVIREWLVLLALSSSRMSMPKDFNEGLSLAFGKACDGVQSGQIELDYHPFDLKTIDIPPMAHPCYMQAVLYWSVQLNCTVNVLAEMHATLGSSPSLEQANSAARQIEREALITQTWKDSAKRRRSGGETLPMFLQTDIYLH